jgi:hypothetical protein
MTPTAPSAPPPSLRQILDETLPLIDIVPETGPPLIFVAVPYLLLVVMLIGPLALLVTMVALFIAVTALVALVGGIVATPYLLVRHHHRHRAAPAASHLLLDPSSETA